MGSPYHTWRRRRDLQPGPLQQDPTALRHPGAAQKADTLRSAVVVRGTQQLRVGHQIDDGAVLRLEKPVASPSSQRMRQGVNWPGQT